MTSTPILQINPGNSGGPAFSSEGTCLGIAFQSLKDLNVENVGYIIPTPVIYHFILDYQTNGQYTGFPDMGIWDWQEMESPFLREGLGMKVSCDMMCSWLYTKLMNFHSTSNGFFIAWTMALLTVWTSGSSETVMKAASAFWTVLF